MKLAILVAAVATIGLRAQGLMPREKPEDYPAHGLIAISEIAHNGGKEPVRAGSYTLATDYLVHTLPTKEGVALVAEDYLVIEVAAYGPKHSKIDLSLGSFTLLLNNKTVLTPESAGTVAASIKYPDWGQKPRVDLGGGASAGNGSVIYGTPQVQKFPGDPSVRSPRPNPVPEENPAGIEKEQQIPIEQRVQAVALAGETPTPFAGLVFFPYRGKTKSIKSLELAYEGPQGKVTLKLE